MSSCAKAHRLSARTFGALHGKTSNQASPAQCLASLPHGATRRAGLRLKNNLPLILVLLAIAGVLLLRARSWSEALAMRIQARETKASAGFTGFVISLGQIVLPILGLVALMRAVDVTGLFGPRGDLLINSVPVVGVIVFSARWLGSRIFPRSVDVETPLGLSERRRWEGRLYAMLLGGFVAARFVLEKLSDFDRFGLETTAVLDFPLILVTSLMCVPHRTDFAQTRWHKKHAVFGQRIPRATYSPDFQGLHGHRTSCALACHCRLFWRCIGVDLPDGSVPRLAWCFDAIARSRSRLFRVSDARYEPFRGTASHALEFWLADHDAACLCADLGGHA